MAQTSNWWFSGFLTGKASTTKACAKAADACQESVGSLAEVVGSRGACSASESTSSTKTARTETDQQAMLSGSSFGPSPGDDTDSAAKVDDADFMVVTPSACQESEQDFAVRNVQRELEPTIASLPLDHHTRDGMHPLSSHGECLKFVPPSEETVETQTSLAGAVIQEENVAIAQAQQLPSTAVPTLHCSEFMKALIEKQHEVERFFPLQPHDIHPNIITKMSMVKNELDLLSSSISGILMKSASAVASPSSHAHHGTFDVAHHQPFASSLQPQDLQRLQNNSGQNTDALHNQPAWSAMDVDGAQYGLESEMVNGGAGVSQYQQNGLVEPAPQMHAPTSTSQYEDNSGPAVFRGFHAPPSYAWGRPLVETRGDDPTTPEDRQQEACPESPESPGSASAVAATPGVPAEAPLHPTRPKSIDMSSPLRGGSCESSMKLAFTAAMEELQKCRSSCASLRVESRGVPVADVETWCSKLGRHLEQLVDKLQEKLETHRTKSRAKDEAIRRLFKQLQDQRCAREIPPQSAPGSAQRSSSTGARGDLLPESSPHDASGSPERCEDHLGDAGEAIDAGMPLRSPRISVEESTPVKESEDVNVVIDCFDDQDLRCAHAEVDGGEDVLRLATPLILPPEVSPAPAAHRNVHSNLVSDDKRTAVVPRSRRSTDVGSQKSLNRQPAEKTQQAHLQRELAQLRRRDNDLGVQLRMRETQVEQLTATLNELQAVTQRQIRLYKRQLDLKDNSLQALHEKFSGHPPSAAAPSTAQSAGCSHAGNPAGSDTGNIRERGARRHPVQASSTTSSLSGVAQVAVGASSPVAGAGAGSVGIASASGSMSLAHAAAQEQRRRGRGGATPRVSDGDRGRANVTWPAKKEPRDRSLGALPHSPWTKHRDVASHAHTQVAAEVSLRRRTAQPENGSFGRSTSADDPHRRKVPKRTQPNYDADPGVIGKSTRHRDGAGVPRQRR